MLVLTRKIGETLINDGDISVTILGMKGKHVRVGIEAPGDVNIVRKELLDSGHKETPRSRAKSVGYKSFRT